MYPISGVPRNDAGSYSGLIFHRYSARPLLLAYSMAVGWANQIRMQRIRQDWFVCLRIQSLQCDDFIDKVPCTSLAQKQVESGSEVIPRCSREPSSGSAEWHENGCLGRRSVGSRQGRTYQTRKRSLVPVFIGQDRIRTYQELDNDEKKDITEGWGRWYVLEAGEQIQKTAGDNKDWGRWPGTGGNGLISINW